MSTKELPQYFSLEDALNSLFGAGTKMIRSARISGGDINDAFRLELSDGTSIFMKSNSKRNLSFFTAEAAGLDAIRQTGAIGTPHLLCYGTDEARGGISFLLMEFITGAGRVANYWETFACQLAKMHQAETGGFVPEGKFGFSGDNYIGAGPQANNAHGTWTGFYRKCRLEPQFRRAERYFPPAYKKKIIRLLDHLEDFLIEPEQPSLLHGDLWSGNVITGDDGRAWLIDPAAYVGHAEADIAMTELFGGFPGEFYAAYKEAANEKACGMQPGYDGRRDLYNLYHLLNHLNLFGRSYFSSVKHIVDRYIAD